MPSLYITAFPIVFKHQVEFMFHIRVSYHDGLRFLRKLQSPMFLPGFPLITHIPSPVSKELSQNIISPTLVVRTMLRMKPFNFWYKNPNNRYS